MVVKNNKQSWIGKTLMKDRPHDFFKTNPKDYPSYMFQDNDKDGVANVFDCKPNNPYDQGIIDAIINAGKNVKERFKSYRQSGIQAVSPPAPKLNKKQRLIAQVSRNIEAQDQAARERLPLYKTFSRIPGRIESMRRRVQEGNISPVMRRKIMAVKRTFQSTFPVIPSTATSATYQYQSKKGQQSGRGRPRGSLDPRYAQYGGVMGYRKVLSEQRRAFRAQIQQQKEMMRIQRQVQQLPQYEQAQPQTQQQQLPPELQGQGVTPDYSQYQQIQQVPQQIPQVEQKRPIATVFKSSGGSPYPPVETQPLAPAQATVPQGYVETVDSFTGRRFLKKLPEAETWIK